MHWKDLQEFVDRRKRTSQPIDRSLLVQFVGISQLFPCGHQHCQMFVEFSFYAVLNEQCESYLEIRSYLGLLALCTPVDTNFKAML